MEATAVAGLALHPHVAAHHLHQAHGNGEPQPGAAVLAGGGTIGLRKSFEDLLLLLRRDADARVAHREVQEQPVVVAAFQLRGDHDFAVLGEFEGVAHQVVHNLVGNALKFTEHGEIVVTAGLESRDDDWLFLHFTVRDTGIGIPPEQQQKIFEAFSQADGSTTRKYGGTGLGLTVSMRLVKMMGGNMWVESQPGRGSCFHFTARMAVSRLARSTKLLCPHIPEGAQFLVVDDNETNRRILRDLLAKYGVGVMVADGAQSALALMRDRAEVGKPVTLLVDRKSTRLN